MNIWRKIERFFKNNQLRFLEKGFGVSAIHPGEIDLDNVKKILVVRQHDQLGDFLLSTPVFKALRQQFPNAYIAIVARKYTSALMTHDQYVDNVLTFYENGKEWDLKRIFGFIKLLRQRYDLAIVLNTVSHSLTSDLIARFSGAKYIIGSEHLKFKGTERNFFYHIASPYDDNERNQSERNLDIIHHIGINRVSPFEHMTITAKEKEWAMHMLQEKGWNGSQKIIAIHPGAGKMGNRWPVDYFARAGIEIAKKHNARLLITWGPGEKDLGDALTEMVPKNSICMTLADIRHFAAMISCVDLFLCNDTGVMHVAAAANVPLVTVFGPTNPAEWKPFGNKFVAIYSKDGNCSSVLPKGVINAADKLLY